MNNLSAVISHTCKRVAIALVIPLLHCCNSKPAGPSDDFRFSLLDESTTGINFNNRIVENDSVNFLTNQYIYIGSGVATADFNNDGLQDIFFSGEQVSCRLYLNKGNFRFEDITQQAGLQTDRWCAGVSTVDINSDGFADIYVAVSHSQDPQKRKNLLFVNQGGLKFTEQAAAYGLDNDGFSTQSAFFDYDKDGDLDVYLMNHTIFQNEPNNIMLYSARETTIAADRLLRNEGVPAGGDHLVFADVTAQAGITDHGYGLGVAISDLNMDGWPDVYVANDFLSNDQLWVNNARGGFTNQVATYLHHQSFNSMGVDMADVNNDHLPDIAVLDMQPEINYRKKTMFAGVNQEKYEMEQQFGGFQPQFTRNMLQLHNGSRWKDSMYQPFFSEIGQLAGISETDWSWSVLMADFDNDGWKDIHVTNGIAKDLTNNDFLFFRNSAGQGRAAQQGGDDDRFNDSLLRDLDTYGSIKVNNYMYRNRGDLTFANATRQTGMDVPSISHGAAYADLDNDGDLDMVINNMNQPAFIWRNELRQTRADSLHNYLTIQLKGTKNNPWGIGTKLMLFAGGKVQFLEQYPTRGYLSSVDSRLHFGLDDAVGIDSLKVTWPDDRTQLLTKVQANQLLVIDHLHSSLAPVEFTTTEQQIFSAFNEFTGGFRHDEKSFYDFGIQRLLPQKYSQLGPPLATADVNGDGLTDFFIGGAAFQSGSVFLQTKTGAFKPQPLIGKNKPGEDAAAVFFDADGDKDEDLLVAAGSTEFGTSQTMNLPRLYVNDGKGKFNWDTTAFEVSVTGIFQVLSTGDYDEDGDLDVFMGGRVLANQFPLPPRSYLLQNNKGKFRDVTGVVCAGLQYAGMVSGAVWTDFDQDKTTDLVLCGEWMPVRFFRNRQGRLEEVSATTGLQHVNGLWRSLVAADIDRDGDMDFVAGNMGLNNKYHAAPAQPYCLYAKDIDGNGSLDFVPAYFIKNSQEAMELFPAIDRTQFAEQVLAIKRKYLLNEDFAKINMKQLISAIGEQNLQEFKCEMMSSAWIENKGKGRFESHNLPLSAQIAPVNAIVATDIDSDGDVDLLLGGNEYQAEAGTGRYDASFGHCLLNDGKGNFTAVPPSKSGFIIEGELKALQVITSVKNERLVLAAVNNDWFRGFKINPK